ncbi:hypothetical protein LTR37_013612 [Vermiconidia calcicola]|uniref:Uncharacterized protein n=1 Tax=Vermiconidia calcicola TaxID=1690605 RepID=A0ACC3MVX9_9PEZI|nr:hypothetical protein LTR37_013612 [Vermiconidia calcicola]
MEEANTTGVELRRASFTTSACLFFTIRRFCSTLHLWSLATNHDVEDSPSAINGIIAMSGSESARQAHEERNKDSPLIRLPPELRNRIYYAALPIKKQMSIKTITCDAPPHVLNLLQVCRALGGETIRIFYANNILTLDVSFSCDRERTYNWLRRFPPYAIDFLRSVCLQGWVWYTTEDGGAKRTPVVMYIIRNAKAKPYTVSFGSTSRAEDCHGIMVVRQTFEAVPKSMDLESLAKPILLGDLEQLLDMLRSTNW